MSTRNRLKPDAARTLFATVRGREQLSPSFVRVTLTGDDLADYRFLGCDQWFRLFLPHEGEDTPRTLPDMGARSIAAYTLTPTSRRPLIRNYTTADFRPADDGPAELDLDVFVDDAHTGPGLTWATAAAPGTTAALLDEGRLYNPPADSTTELVVGDESALPAVASILRDAPAHLTGLAVIEVRDPADRRELPAPAGIEVVWVTRDPGAPGRAASDEVRRRGVPQGLGYAYLAGHNSMATGLRRWLVKDNGVPRERVSFTGYWR